MHLELHRGVAEEAVPEVAGQHAGAVTVMMCVAVVKAEAGQGVSQSGAAGRRARLPGRQCRLIGVRAGSRARSVPLPE